MIGFAWSVIWILMSVMIGMMVLKHSSESMKNNLTLVMSGNLSLQAFKSATTSYLISGLFLILPGVLSDFFGLLTLVYAFYLQYIAKITAEENNINFNNKGNKHVIDVEIIDECSGSDRITKC